MPQVQVIDTTPNKPEPTGVQEFFSKLSKSYKDKADQDQIAGILKEHQANQTDKNQIFKSYEALERSNIGPTKRLQAKKDLKELEELTIERDKSIATQAKTVNDALKEQKEKARAKESVYEMYKEHIPEEDARRLSEVDTEATARAKIKDLTKKGTPAALSPFERTLQGEEAKKLVKLEEDIPKARDALSNLDRIEQLAKNELAGPKGFLKSAIGTESAKELENLSFTAIEPIIKLFNPVGPIPVQKLKIIQKQFQIHPSDIQSKQRGKIAALRRIGEQGLARAEQRASIIRQYKGSPPPEDLQQFDRESSQLQDALIDQEAFSVKIKGSKDTDLIEGLYSVKDGRKLKGIPKKEAEKLYEQGLITNVPPS